MKLRVGQLFVREIAGSENTYMVCGIIKTDKPLATEATHVITTDSIKIWESEDVRETTRGCDFSGIMTSPLWKVKL